MQSKVHERILELGCRLKDVPVCNTQRRCRGTCGLQQYRSETDLFTSISSGVGVGGGVLLLFLFLIVFLYRTFLRF